MIWRIYCGYCDWQDSGEDQEQLSVKQFEHHQQAHRDLPVRATWDHDPDPNFIDPFVERQQEQSPLAPAHISVADQLRTQIVADNLIASGASNAALEATYAAFHGQALSGIPYYESFTGPDIAAAWAKFQALDTATQQRLMFNLCRTVAAMMRYLTGHLPYVDQAHVEGIAVPSGTDLTDFIDAAAATAVATPDGVDVYGQTFND